MRKARRTLMEMGGKSRGVVIRGTMSLIVISRNLRSRYLQ